MLKTFKKEEENAEKCYKKMKNHKRTGRKKDAEND